MRYAPKIWLYMIQYLHCRVLKFPHISSEYTSTYMLYIHIYNILQATNMYPLNDPIVPKIQGWLNHGLQRDRVFAQVVHSPFGCKQSSAIPIYSHMPFMVYDTFTFELDQRILQRRTNTQNIIWKKNLKIVTAGMF